MSLQPTVGTSEMSQVQLEEQLLACMRESAGMRKDLQTQATAAGRAKARYRSARARKILTMRREWTGTERMTSVLLESMADADEEIAALDADADVAEALFAAAKESMRLLGDEMSGWQSLLADIRPMVSR